MLSKNDTAQLNPQRKVLSSFPSSDWVANESQFVTIDPMWSTRFAGYNLSNEFIYGPEYHFDLLDVENPKETYIKVNVEGQVEEDGQLTASFVAKRNGVPVKNVQGEDYWEGRDLETMMKDTDNGYFVFKIPHIIEPGDDCMISFWNRNPESAVIIRSVEIQVVDNIWN